MSDDREERALPVRVELGAGSVREDVDILLDSHEAAMLRIPAAREEMSDAVDLIVQRLADGGRLIYVGAGTSGWLAALDAAEVVVTFGMTGRVESVVAGGHVLDPSAMTLGDDAIDSVDEDPVLSSCTSSDVVLAVSASGSTPFTVAAVDMVSRAGASVIAVVSQPDSALSQRADVVILTKTPAEVVSGSTRLAAGLTQKVVLNTLSTVSMTRLGRTVGGQMVCVLPLNEKLRRRIVQALSLATGADLAAARDALERAGSGDVAAVALLGGIDVDSARERLERHRGDIHRAVADVSGPAPATVLDP